MNLRERLASTTRLLLRHRLVLLLLLAALVSFWFWTSALDQSLTVYDYDDQAWKGIIAFHVHVPQGWPVEKKLGLLAGKVARYRFSLPIEVKGVESRPEGTIAVINLRERDWTRNIQEQMQELWDQGKGEQADKLAGQIRWPTWCTDYFQGSSGGNATTHSLRQSFLQPEYRGDWVDGVVFHYEGEPISCKWDHITLTGVFLRDGRVVDGCEH